MSFVGNIRSPWRLSPHYKVTMAKALITSPTGYARAPWRQLFLVIATAMMALAAGAPRAAAQDATWKATTREVLKGLGRCYVEPRRKQSWRFERDHLLWETRSTGRVKIDRRTEVPIAIMEGARLSRTGAAPGYPYLVELRLAQAVTAAASVGGQANPDFNYETATVSCALRSEKEAARLADAINRLIALATSR
jgi:hypothetical protein